MEVITFTDRLVGNTEVVERDLGFSKTAKFRIMYTIYLTFNRQGEVPYLNQFMQPRVPNLGIGKSVDSTCSLAAWGTCYSIRVAHLWAAHI